MSQINELTTRTFDGDSLIGFDVENADPQTQAEYPYVTGKADGNAVANFIANGQEYVTNLDTVNKHINGAINELHAINGYSYDAYDDTATYAVGDLCIYNNTLYKCTTAITTPEAWNASHWTATSIADEINEINGKLIKRVSETVQLSQVIFTQSSSGMYYYEKTLNIPNGSLIVSISCGNWGKLRSTDIIEPYIAGSNKLGLMSNIGTFVNDSVIELIAIYI